MEIVKYWKIIKIIILKMKFLFYLIVLNSCNVSAQTSHWIFEYLNALFDGLKADTYVPGTTLCAINF